MMDREEKKVFDNLYQVLESEETRRRRKYMSGIKHSFIGVVWSLVLQLLANALSVSGVLRVFLLFVPIVPFVMLFVFIVLYIR